MEKHQTLSETHTENSDSQLTKENLFAAWDEKYGWMDKKKMLFEITRTGSVEDLEIADSEDPITLQELDKYDSKSDTRLMDLVRKREQSFLDFLYEVIATRQITNDLKDQPFEMKYYLLEFAIAFKQSDDIILDLISTSEPTNADDSKKNYASHFYYSVEDKRANIIKKLLEKATNANMNFIYKSYEGYMRLLPIAIKNSDYTTAKLLLDHGADPNATNPISILGMPLPIAIKSDDENLVELLLTYKADPNKFLNDNSEIPLNLAVSLGNIKMVELLLKFGANINENDIWPMRTALHYAVVNNHLEIINILLANGADADINSSYEGKSIHIAAKYGRIEAIEIILKHLPNSIDSDSAQGQTPLHLAIENEELTAVKLLLEKGANVNIPDKENRISLHLAVEKNSLEMVDLLLAHDNININTQDLNLKTSLHIAIEKGNAAIVQRLLKNGALITLTDNKNKKPIDIAEEKGHIEIVELLNIQSLEDYAKELSTRSDNDRLSFFGYKVGDKKKAVDALKSVVCDYKKSGLLISASKNFK